ncbi:FtsI [Desulfamplus magnetovallimortis]|uniref:FtsI n=1 Tax=Desulfamplus magnetovallimortis TaxID=1246637 RepID=A0A1W1HE27_9BACT|nr:penicillin-binding protein 2 [Desulfamplus magnetovallimortis]SLM30693.1 FtsI [Desulfamplus magnetovallimortis]
MAPGKKPDSKAKTNQGINARITFLQWALVFVMLLLAMKAVDIQIFQSSELTQKAEKEYIRQITVNGKRGDIVDRNMKKLCITIDTLSVAANPRMVVDASATAKKLAEILGVNRKKLQKNLESKKSFVWIKRKISPSESEKIKKYNFKGIFFKDDLIRFHPQKELAAQVTGITGSDGKGLEGIEFQYNKILNGESRRITIEKDAAGRYYSEEKDLRDKLKGDTIVLTIDSTIQFIAEKALEQAVTEHKAKSGMAIVMIPSTGEILAMAHAPAFNPNSFTDFERDRWRNRSVTDPFEPGSTMKVFVAAAAMELEIATPMSIFFCENGKYRVGRSTVHDTHEYEWLTLKQIIKYSSNIGAIKLSEIMGKKQLYNTLLSFGFGKESGIECPGDSPGLLSHYDRWSAIDTAAISFGQGISVSAVQLINAISAIANGGTLMRPRIIKEIKDSNGEIRQPFVPESIKRVISKSTAIKVKDMMRAVVEEGGTATQADLNGYSVCGKTGTAQKVSKSGGYSKSRYTALFAAFAPMENPELAVLVVVDEPPKSHYGGVVAAPAVKKIFSESFHYLKIPPDINTKTEHNQ